ncbi:MAG: hypothetical protein ACW975_14495 [Candidatus Thorarchaeota archaeon]|jgi:hypothetical protein
MSAIDLAKKYQEISNLKMASAFYNQDEETILTLCKTRWIRIVVIRKPGTTEAASIEVELSVPDCVAQAGAAPTRDDHRDLLNGVIIHFEYLKRLFEAGFALDLIAGDCLWTAYCEVKNAPDTRFFELITPPNM